MGVTENTKGLILAMASSAFIGSSFILKKKGLKRAGAAGTRAGQFYFHLKFLVSPVYAFSISMPLYHVLFAFSGSELE